MGRRHLTPKEIIAQCKAVARESRMADRTPWSALGIICSYVIMKREGFKGQRILRLTEHINQMEMQWKNGEIDLDAISNRLYEKTGWSVGAGTYTEADITAKKGTYQYWIDQKQIAPQNAINEQATRYLLFFFTALMDLYGFGKDRMTRVQEYMDDLLEAYQQEKTTVYAWKKAIFEEAGVIVEMPIDPLTQTRGSLMTGA